MQLLSLLALTGLASSVVARSPEYSGRKFTRELPARPRHGYPKQPVPQGKRQEKFIVPQNEKTASV
jgi:carboxypeptidase D